MSIESAESKFYHFQRGTSGSFYTALFNAIMKADSENTEKLRLGFPEEVEVVSKFYHESGYYEKLELRMTSPQQTTPPGHDGC